ncbi:hypothetical protein Tco_0608702 [Tanacetum coccineum]
MSVVRNMAGQEKEISQGNLNGSASDATLRKYCDKHYNQLLPILAKKMYQENVQQEKLKALKARLNFEEVSQHSESRTPSRRRDLRKRLGSRRIRNVSGKFAPEKHHNKRASSRRTDYYQKVKEVQEDTRSHDQKSKGQELRMTIYPNHGYARKLICSLPAAAKVEPWAMPTWCHMFNSTLTGSDRKKCIKDPVEIHHIKQRKRESTEDFVRRFKIESRDVKGAPKVMRISRFMHGLTNPEMIKRLHDKILKSVDEMMKITTYFLRGSWQLPWQRVARQRITKSFSPDPEISFPPLEEEKGTEGPMIIEAEIRGHFIHRIRWGQISLLVKIGDEEHSTSAWMNFVIVRLSFPYNGIIGRPGVRKIQAVPSTTHGMLKFPVPGGILTLKSSKIIPIKCAAVSGPEGQPPTIYQAIEERIKVAINPEYPEQTIMIGSTLTEEGRNKLCDLLQRNLDVFAWKPADMTGVPRHIAEHRLNLRKGCPPVRQEVKKRMRTRPYKKKLKNSLMLVS